MKRKDKSARRVFWWSLSVSLFLFLTAAGFITVDYQGRRVSFGDDVPPFRLVDKPGGEKDLEIRLFGGQGRVDVTNLDNFWDILRDFACIPHR